MVEELSRAEIDDLLRGSGTGVLSLTDGAETYAVPESFGYDDDHLYFQFVYGENSHKMAFMETTDVATFTVYTEDPAESVVVRGRLEPVPEAERPRAATAIAENADIPTLNVDPESSPAELSMAFYRLVPDEVSGRAFHGFASSADDS